MKRAARPLCLVAIIIGVIILLAPTVHATVLPLIATGPVAANQIQWDQGQLNTMIKHCFWSESKI